MPQVATRYKSLRNIRRRSRNRNGKSGILSALADGAFVPYVIEASYSFNEAFRDLFPHGLPPETPLVTVDGSSSGAACGDPATRAVEVSDRVPDLKLDWERCEGEWSLLTTCDPPPYATGVYVIWEPLLFVRGRRAVCVGQGPIRARLAEHRRDERIGHHGTGSLLVTWAPCRPDARAGVVRFLAARYRPYENESDPRADPVSVNLPL